jgi:hypothetical protein
MAQLSGNRIHDVRICDRASRTVEMLKSFEACAGAIVSRSGINPFLGRLVPFYILRG